MKKIVASFFTLSLLLLSCSFPQTSTAPPPAADLNQFPWEDRSIFENGLIESQQAILHELAGASVYHLEFEIAEDLYHVRGHEDVRYTNTETIPLHDVHLRLFPNVLGGKMEVSNVQIDDRAVEPKYDLQQSRLVLPLATPLEPEQSTVIAMDFAVEVPRSVEAHYGVLVYAQDVLALAHAYPMIAVYDDEGWNAEIPTGQGDVTYADASFYVIKITAPKDVTLVATGSEISRKDLEQTQALTIANGPARDFFVAASATYEEMTQSFGDMTIHSYAPKQQNAAAKVALTAGGAALEDFTEHYGPYPYTELDFISTPTTAGGIEYPGLVVVASALYDQMNNAPGASARLAVEGVVAHEVGHQWFYNLVGDDQLDDPWLDEAFAQFATLQYFRDEYGTAGEEELRNSLEARWARVEHAEIPIGLPVASYTEKEYGAIVYGRGPLFLVELRREMGDSVFDEFLKDYVKQLSWGIATPEFMQTLAEKHCNCNLEGLFQEWVYR